ncbi:PTS sugar transporter subunit IIA [Vagococcus sp. BWB3-3]|uniref:PTS sugar transporter subunit IIA n=1 Tax=Vagococcus allomyrinae TaxID=2794353 RepID=A0A940PG78_9ENTE|nr:PTS sugar transporter subunit IIA [Vagococcus allomyrinae]MBP1042293.1 PTS sugar transporter subunit IIA [Vagococcus allomyrinae]
MIGIIVLSHGDFAEEAIQSAALLAGQQPSLIGIGLHHGKAPEQFRQELQVAIKKLDVGEGVLVLVDFYGGTPANEVMKLMKTQPIHVVSGLNLGMLLEVILKRDQVSLADLAAIAVNSGVATIVDMNQRYQELTKEGEDGNEECRISEN